MFTGIVSHLGVIGKKEGSKLTVREPDLAARIHAGDSIAVNGICLTAAAVLKDGFTVEFSPETETKTTIGTWQENDSLNLELPVGANGLFAGHIVQGHIDGVGTVKNVATEGNSHRVEILPPPDLLKYIVHKGSIAIDGASLTVVMSGKKDTFSVVLIPHTLEHTTLQTLQVGDTVNIEVDILAKYLEKLSNNPS